MVDWSANNAPKKGADSIWIADADLTSSRTATKNPATRSDAMRYIESVIIEMIKQGKQLFIGFDFAFGYPIGSNSLPGRGRWEAIWAWLCNNIDDDDDNKSNRFEIASRLNELHPEGHQPFWGLPWQHEDRYSHLKITKPDYTMMGISERRTIDEKVKSAQPVWKLAGNGSVGSQALLGIARLEKLRRGPLGKHIAIWPFETRFCEDLSKPVVIGELYPSLYKIEAGPDEIKDEVQVRTLAEKFRQAGVKGEFESLLAGPKRAGSSVREAAVTHEAWMVGFGDDIIDPDRSSSGYDYIRDPAEIYTRSFATVEREAGLDRLPKPMRPVATRLIHACGMVDVIEDLEFSPKAVEAGQAALLSGRPIYTDVEMVKAGVIEKFLPKSNECICLLNDSRVPDHAKLIGNTRSAAAVDFWDRIEGSIVVIGNAPTALFRVLEKLDEGWDKPALIIGIPVGFVGAVESKQALAETSSSVEYITVHGRRGGSAMASSVVNALANGLSGRQS